MKVCGSHNTASWIILIAVLASYLHHTDASIQVRLVGGSRYSEGRVEVRQGSSGSWGTVCDDNWNITDANVVCRMLGFTGATRAVMEAGFGRGSGLIQMDDLACTTSSLTLDGCSYSGWGTHNCQHSEDAGAICSVTPIEVRLMDGTYRSGRVEVRRESERTWGTICDHGWDTQDADVVCSILGLRSSAESVSGTENRHGSGPIYLRDVGCIGSESAMEECSLLAWGDNEGCSHDDDVWVICEGNVEEIEVRLMEGTYRSGRVEIRRGTQQPWGTICDHGWDTQDADVVCRILGFGSSGESVSRSGYRPGSGPIYLTEVGCHGSENEIGECSTPNWGYNEGCFHDNDAWVICIAPTELSVRLMDGNYRSGRLEVRQGNAGSWGSVCNTGWDVNDEHVACRTLGFRFTSNSTDSKLREPSHRPDDIWISEVGCRGSESSLSECPVPYGWGRTYGCSHTDDVELACSADELEVRLVGGTYSSGLVEVRQGSSGEWGSICSAGWGMNEADVICRMMGFPSAEIAVKAKDKGYASSNGSIPIQLENVSCMGDEENLGNCHSNSWGSQSCSYDMEAGVLCSRLEIRIAGRTKTSSSGRVEVRRAGTGESWGTICDDKWDINAAHVACRMLGFNAAESAVREGGFGLGTEEIYLDEVVCNGSESSIDSGCSYRWKSHDCGHSEDAGIICAIATCESPPRVDNALNIPEQSDWNVGDIITYICRAGFVLSSALATSECLDTKIWSPHPSCVLIICGPPRPIQNGFIEESSGVSYNDSTLYECNAGYTMMTDSRSYCTEEGDWSSVPECHELSCGTPPIVEHARITELQGLSLGNLVRYQCVKGYSLGEHDFVLCLSDGKWSSNPICKGISCGQPPSILNAYISQANTTYTGDTYIPKCITGYEMIGEPSVCLTTQEWSTPPKCQIISCGLPPVKPNSDQTNQHTSYGSWAEYHCSDGYECLDCRSTVYCLASGSWEEPPVCDRKRCGPPPLLANSTYTVNGTQFGDHLFYECVEGFTMVGNQSLECQSNGNWTLTPKCQAIICGNPPKVEQSAVTVTGDGYDDRASYSCNEGYELSGNGTSYCLSTGNWSRAPSCTIVSCDSPPSVSNASVNTTEGTYGDLAVYKCETGFEMIGNRSIKCLSSGAWSTSPICNEITCGEPPNQQFATVDWSGDHYRSTATYICHSGYRLVGNSTTFCQMSGEWKKPPVCEALTCGKPPSVANTHGILNYAQWRVGEAITYRCLPGYEMSGRSISHCMEDQQWSQSPTCTSPSHSTINNDSAPAAPSTIKSISATSTSRTNSSITTTPDGTSIQTWVTRENNTALTVQKQPVNITFKYISSDSTGEGAAEIGTNLTDYGDHSGLTNMSSSAKSHDKSGHAARGPADNSSVTSDSKGQGYNRSSVVIGCSALAGIAVVIAGAAVAYWIYTKKRVSMVEESNFVPIDNQMYNGTELKSITVYSFKQPREDGSEDI